MRNKMSKAFEYRREKIIGCSLQGFKKKRKLKLEPDFISLKIVRYVILPTEPSAIMLTTDRHA